MKCQKVLLSCLALVILCGVCSCQTTVIVSPSSEESSLSEISSSESSQSSSSEVHTHTSSELLYNDMYHYTVCTGCGQILYQEEHTLHTYYDLDYHYTQCEICDYMSDKEEHTLTTTYIDNIYHEISCSVCDYKSQYNHEAISSEDNHCALCNAELNISDITYTLDQESNSYIVTKYTGSSDILFIPLTHQGLPVTTIGGGSATGGAFYNNRTIKYVGLNSNIVTVEDYAFYNCQGLERIDIPNSIKNLGTYSYNYCNAVSEISIDASDATFNMGVFSLNKALTKITFKENAKNISFKGSVFSSLSEYTDIYFDGRIANWFSFSFTSETGTPAYSPYEGSDFYLKDYETNEYELMTSLNIPEGVSEINDYSFYKIKSLETLILSRSVSSIGYQSFYKCLNLKGVYFPLDSELTSISQWAFGYNSSLEEVIIPSGVTYIGHDSFYSTNLKAVFYQGDESSFNKIDIEESPAGYITFENVPIYYYKEEEPTEDGNWWHYDKDLISPLKW